MARPLPRLGPSDDDSVAGFDLRTLNGKTIGTYANATEKIRRLENFLEFNGLDCTVLRLDLASYESCLDDGTADLMLGSDVEMKDGCKVVAEFDGEQHYLAVPEGSDLMAGIDEAMRQIYAGRPQLLLALRPLFPRRLRQPHRVLRGRPRLRGPGARGAGGRDGGAVPAVLRA